MEEKQNIAYYAMIPATVLYKDDLKPNQKLLYAIITSLSNKEGYCYATNRYLAGKLKEHLISINNEAEKRIKNAINDMCIKEKVNENLKEKDQMKWVGMINNFKNIAEEIILKELIYV